MDEGYDDKLSQFITGLKRKVASTRAESGRSLDEGEKGMSFNVYKNVYVKFFLNLMMTFLHMNF